jgi:hypothetical protein
VDARDVGDRLEPVPLARIVRVGHDDRDVLAIGHERLERADADGVVREDSPARAPHSSTSVIT